jgi:hypothetical protein
MIQAIIKPVVIKMRGISFRWEGKVKILFVISIIHLIALPATMDVDPRSIVGKIIFICSLILRRGFVRLGPHNTINLNRTE